MSARIPRRVVAVGLAAVLSGTAAGTSTSWSAPKPPKAPTLAATCAAPALEPGLRARPWKGAGARAQDAVRVAAAGRGSGSARAQALAVTAALAGDLAPGGEARAFYVSLRKVEGWASLPPTIAIHRVLGTPDPFAYEDTWGDATTLLAKASGLGADEVAQAVSAGGSAPARCRPSADDARGLPLPPGSAYRVAFASSHGDTSFLAACGTPVLSATPWTVELTRDGSRTGPWVIRVRDRGQAVTTSYAHVQLPRVRDGQTVVVGQQIGEVGDLGDVRRCELGLRVDPDEGRAYDRAELLGWLSTQPRPEKKAEKEPRVRTIPPTSFRMATFNVLGSHLTAGRGGGKARYAPGPTRMARGLARIEASGVSIAVFNEFESPAAAVVSNDGDWTLHRATPNNNFRNGNSAGNAVAWRTDTWKLVTTSEFTVPYKTTLHMPVVTLQNLGTGARVTVVGVHNPASGGNRGNQAGARAVARRIELTNINAIRQAEPDVPVLFAGDMNERNEAFCGFTVGGLLRSSAGGSVGAPCRVPRHGPVDWIFGTTDVTFGGQVIDRSTLGSVSDHPLLSASVTIPEQQR